MRLSRHDLLSVEKPARYLGGEMFSVGSPRRGDFKICLLFPDLYEIGISYYGFQVLYHILNATPGVHCERACLPAADMQAVLRRRRQPLCSLESGTPLRDFDAVGITLQTELHYPGVAKALDLAGISLYASERSPDNPWIIGGGPCAFHPEPVAPFFDIFLLGDAEEALPALILQLLRDASLKRASRRERWEAAARMEGVYAPQLYGEDGDSARLIPLNGAPRRIRAHAVLELKTDYYPDRPLVPSLRGVHDRLTVEIMRGCTQGCRFCQAGIIQRPVRERSVSELVSQVMRGVEKTGMDEVGLLSLSTSDYSALPELLGSLTDALAGSHTTLAFPSLRPATFTDEMARVNTGGRKTSLTFAVEAGSERLRAVINKSVTDDELLIAAERAWRYGWKTVKLYFMVGLPGETDDDLEAGAPLLKRLGDMVPRGRELHVSVSPFIPKPHTVFEGELFFGESELERRTRLLCRELHRPWVKLDRGDPARSLMEATLARGRRSLAPALAALAEAGDGLEAWWNRDSRQRWIATLDRFAPDWREALEALDSAAPRPWSHLAKGVTPKFLRDDRQAALRGERLADCREDECYQCGLSKLCEQVKPPSAGDRVDRESVPDRIVSSGGDVAGYPYRLIFSKLGRASYLGHHDLIRTLVRSLRRAGVQFIYSRGLSPRPRLTHPVALPVGVGAARLALGFKSAHPLNPEELLLRLRESFPQGLRPVALLEPDAAGAGRNGRQRTCKVKFDRRVPVDAAGVMEGDVRGGKPAHRIERNCLFIDIREDEGFKPVRMLEASIRDRLPEWSAQTGTLSVTLVS